MVGIVDQAQHNRLCLEWLEEEFPGMTVSMITHWDEKTPHNQAVIVPKKGETKDGLAKLNFAGLLSSREKYIKLQDSYAKKMESLGLQRGVQHSGVEHQTLKELRIEDHRAYERAKEIHATIAKALPEPEMPPPLLEESWPQYQERLRKKTMEHLERVKNELERASKAILEFAASSIKAKAAQRRVEVLQAQVEAKKELIEEMKQQNEKQLAEMQKELDVAHEEIARLTATGEGGKDATQDLKTIRILPKPGRGQLEVA
jgi:lysyl-tRNA synthetase class I